MSEENCSESDLHILNIKITFILMVVVKSNGREIGFRGLLLVREVLVSRTVTQKILFKKVNSRITISIFDNLNNVKKNWKTLNTHLMEFWQF
jgi:hypothetical protein